MSYARHHDSTRRTRYVAWLVGALASTVFLGGCGSVSLVASTNIPTPLVSKVPVAVALHVPKEFAAYVHKEERWSTDWNIELGKAQSEGITRLLTAMFDRVVIVDSVNAGAQAGEDVKAILEPSVEEYAFVTPRDAGSPFFAVSIKYRVNVYSPDGRLADSWGFTGYGTSPSQGISSSAPLATATALALRDAGAKLAVEFREQAIVRGLLPDAPAPSMKPAPAAEEPAPAPAAETPAAPPSEPKIGTEPEQKPAPPPAPAQSLALGLSSKGTVPNLRASWDCPPNSPRTVPATPSLSAGGRPAAS